MKCSIRKVFLAKVVLISMLLINLNSCDGTMGKPKKNTNVNEHSYNSDDDKKINVPPTPVKEATNDNMLSGADTRDIWQEPLKVIRQLGNLEGKTLADIGAGPFGYFTFPLAGKTNLSKVLAIDIDSSAINFIEKGKAMIPTELGDKIETRLVTPVNAKLKPGEADIVLIVNTSSYFDDRVAYFSHLKEGIAKDGRLIIIDFKMKQGPFGPPLNSRIPLGVMEQELTEAGYAKIVSDDTTLDHQYIVIAKKD